MLVWDVIVNGEVKEGVESCECGCTMGGYFYLRDGVLPKMVEKYGEDVVLKRRLRSLDESVLLEVPETNRAC